MFLEMERFTHYKWLNYVLIVIMMFLNGFGIFIGRFLRLHSVYLINEPMRIFKEVVLRTDINAFGFILLLVVLQVLLFSFAKGVRAIK